MAPAHRSTTGLITRTVTYKDAYSEVRSDDNYSTIYRRNPKGEDTILGTLNRRRDGWYAFNKDGACVTPRMSGPRLALISFVNRNFGA